MTSTPAPVYDCFRRRVSAFPSCSDPLWSTLPKMHLSDTVTGSPPRLATAVQAFWDGDSLYFHFDCDDDHAVATFRRHDDPIYHEDVVEVFLSETGLLTTYKEFEVSPANVRFDAIVHNDLQGGVHVDTRWHANDWTTVVTEFPELSRRCYIWRLPLRNFEGAPPAPGDVWLMNCYRIDRGRDLRDEYSAWSPTGVVNYHVPERFGRLRFCE